jgi:hypothetical protein
MTRYQVFIRCQELPSAHAEYTYSLDAHSFERAVFLGVKQFRQESHVHRRKLTTVELRVTALCHSKRTAQISVLKTEIGQAGE